MIYNTLGAVGADGGKGKPMSVERETGPISIKISGKIWSITRYYSYDSIILRAAAGGIIIMIIIMIDDRP